MFTAGFFRLRADECELPDGRVMPRYYVIEFPDWVNVVPLTMDGHLVMIEQYRHAAGEDFLEIPGGSTDSITEDPRAAGERELLEETGYQADEWIYCGYHFPNPALQNNKMHTFLALGCKKVRDPSLDPFEDLRVTIQPVDQVIQRWRTGQLKHSLIATSFGLSLPYLEERGFC